MNTFWTVFVTSVKRHIRTITPLIMQVSMPLVLIVILGSIFNQQFSTETTVDPVKLAIVNESNGSEAEELTQFLESDELGEFIDVTSENNLDTARQDLNDMYVDAVLYIDKNSSSDDVQNGITMYMDKEGNEDAAQMLMGILEGWQDTQAAVAIRLQEGVPLDNLMDTINTEPDFIKASSFTAEGSVPGAMDYFAVTMIVMTLVFTGILTLVRLSEDFLKPMGWRLKSTPVPISVTLAGNIISNIAIGFIQTVIVLLFTKWVYGVEWGSNWWIILGTLIVMTTFGHLLASTLVLGLRDENAANGVFFLCAMGLPFLAGTFHPSLIGGSIGQFLTTYGTPQSLAQTAIFSSIYGGDTAMIIQCMGILAILTIILMVCTVLLARRRVL